MAQEIVHHVVSKLQNLKRGGDDLTSLYGMRDDIHWMRKELKKLLCFLKDGDGDAKQSRDGDVESWMKGVVKTAHGVEDLVDGYLFRANRFPHYYSAVHSRRSFFNRVDELKQTINGLSAQRSKLGLVNPGTRRYIPNKVSGSGAQNSECDNDVISSSSIVGFAEERKIAIGQLKRSDERLLVVSVVGTSGVGKTALAKEVYRSADIRRMFVTRGWVTVTKHCKVADILKNAIKELVKIPKKVKGEKLSRRSKCIVDEVKEGYSLEGWKEEEINLALHELIKIKGKCLIVMDNVHRKEIWGRIQNAFVGTDNGSRVFITTRSLEVGKFVNPDTNPCELGPLNETESKVLFLKKIFPDDIVHEFMDDLKEIGEKLIGICEGLPLNLVLLGGLLSRKAKAFTVWSKVLEALTLKSNNILNLCYDELPLDLKPCLLFITAFEEGIEINASKLKRLWMAESLVSGKKGDEEREQIANRYIEELNKRSLVQITKRKYNGNPSRIRVHCLIRELCNKVSKYNNFFISEGRYSKDDPSEFPPAATTARRLAFHGSISNTYFDPVTSDLTTPSLRTFICSGSLKLQHRLGHHLERLKLLTVIDVEGERRLTTIPNEVSNLIHLRYLRWIVHSNQGVKKLPSLRNLRNLQTLVTNATATIEDGVDGLKNIRCLTHVKCGYLVARQLIKFADLRRLKITFVEEVMLNQFEKHRTLESLSIYGEKGSVPMEAFTVFPALRKLKIYGVLTDTKPLPVHSAFPEGLTKLTLSFSCLAKDPMSTLEKLPNLAILSLEDRAYLGKSMVCSDRGFPGLLRLAMKKLERLEDWVVALGAMGKLRNLTVEGCRRLKMLPEGLQHINSLKEIKLVQVGNMVIIE